MKRQKEIEKEINVWDFVEKYYPEYYTSEVIAEHCDLSKIAECTYQDGDDAHKLLMENYDGDINNPRIEKDLLYITEQIYREAILHYLSLQKSPHP